MKEKFKNKQQINMKNFWVNIFKNLNGVVG